MEHNEQITLINAIKESQSHNTIIKIDWDTSTIDEALEFIVAWYDGETDYVQGAGLDGDITEIWGWEESNSENEMEFRVHLRAVKGLLGD